MNVGPTARGYFDYRAEKALKVYGDWMKVNGRSIYNCTMAEPEFKAPRGTRLTQSEDGKRLYIHLVEYPYAFLEFEGLGDKIDYAQFLHDASEIIFRADTFEQTEAGSYSQKDSIDPKRVIFTLPVVKPSVTIPVIEVFLKNAD